MAREKPILGLIDTGIHPELDYLSGLDIQLTRLDGEGRPYKPVQVYKGDRHGSQVASIISGPYYGKGLPPLRAIRAIAIPRHGKTMLCLLRALDAMLDSGIRVLCLPVGINQLTPVFRPFTRALTDQGVLIVVPAGNKGNGTLLTPGIYPEVLTVGALDGDGQKAVYSGRRKDMPHKPEVYARGEFPDPAAPHSGQLIRGTSMACAYVAGRAARTCQQHSHLTLKQVRTELSVNPSKEIPIPLFGELPYFDRRLQRAMPGLPGENELEGIVIARPENREKEGLLPIDMLLKETAVSSSLSAHEVQYFNSGNVVHLKAKRHFFEALLKHRDLLCIQAVKVSVFDL